VISVFDAPEGGMTRRVSSIVAALLLLAHAACFAVPLGPPGTAAPDVALLGKWQCASVADGEKKVAALDVVRFDDSQYYVEWVESAETRRYRAYPTRIGSIVLVNVEELEGRFTPWPWAVVRPELVQDGTLKLAVVDAKAFRATEDEAAVREVTQRVSDSAIYRMLGACTHRDP
jgi:hypothetical protein